MRENDRGGLIYKVNNIESLPLQNLQQNSFFRKKMKERRQWSSKKLLPFDFSLGTYPRSLLIFYLPFSYFNFFTLSASSLFIPPCITRVPP